MKIECNKCKDTFKNFDGLLNHDCTKEYKENKNFKNNIEMARFTKKIIKQRLKDG